MAIHNEDNPTMKIQVRETWVVRPRPGPRTTLWLSNLDMVLPMYHHTFLAYFFRFNGTSNFFDSTAIKGALSRALDVFYPVAGRLRRNGKRLEIDCNGEGVLFVEAETDGRIDELGDFCPRSDVRLVPMVDYSKGIGTYPLLLVQLTRFKCGGVCLGIGIEHHLYDGTSVLHFVNTWSDIARGLDVKIPPFLNRQAVLSARDPPQPKFAHVEYQPLPTLKISQDESCQPKRTLVYRHLKVSRDQLNALKMKCNEDTTYTTYEVVTAHIWRCAAKARRLPDDQVSKLHISVNGRSRLQPPLPQGYFGNVVFTAAPMATAGELRSKPLKFIAKKIHDAIARIDHEYALSALDYLELQRDFSSVARGPHTSKSPNLVVTNWSKLPFYDADFGWGRPIYAGPGAIQSEGKIFVIASPMNDGGLWIATPLLDDHMKHFEHVFYEDDKFRSRI